MQVKPPFIVLESAFATTPKPTPIGNMWFLAGYRGRRYRYIAILTWVRGKMEMRA